MFDARSLLEGLMRGGAPQQQQQPAGGGLGDLLGKMMGGAGQQQGQAAGGAGGLEEMLRKMMAGAGGGGQGQPGQANSQGGSIEDMLRKMMPGGGGQAGGQAQGAGGGNLMDILGKVLGQATSGVKEVAGRADQATGASGRVREMTGQSPDDMLAKLKELIGQHQAAAAATAGGVGAVVLGTKAGRSLAGSALKIGGLALIGGLAYKALQNYQAGRPLITGADAGLTEAPRGSGYESQAVTNESAVLYIRGMIAAAAADGRIDEREQQKIMGSLKQAGMDRAAEEFLANELNNPASIDDLAGSVKSEQEAVQLFTAARIAVDLDSQEENEFLVGLAQRLGMSDDLVQHIDAAASAQT
jgi:uncharacterized membrane protein YebE (DUF533 family)